MSIEPFPEVNKNSVTRVIRELAAESSSVVITRHALERMQERGITRTEVGRCLQCGQQQGEAQINERDNWQVELLHRVAGRRLVVQAVLLEQDERKVLVVTTWRVL